MSNKRQRERRLMREQLRALRQQVVSLRAKVDELSGRPRTVVVDMNSGISCDVVGSEAFDRLIAPPNRVKISIESPDGRGIYEFVACSHVDDAVGSYKEFYTVGGESGLIRTR